MEATNSAKRSPRKGTYYLATTENVPRFYCFSVPVEADAYTLIEHLDTGRLTGAPDKAAAKRFAQALGLKTWQYVRQG